jgi:hypothetical protein
MYTRRDLTMTRPFHSRMMSFGRTLDEICDACRETIAQAGGNSTLEIIPLESSLVLNVRSHFEPEALVRIRISHPSGLDKPAGESEDKARAEIEERLHALGVKRS